MSDERNVQARLLKQVRVHNTAKPGFVVLEMNTGNQTDYVAVPRGELAKIADLLSQNAAEPVAADGPVIDGPE